MVTVLNVTRHSQGRFALLIFCMFAAACSEDSAVLNFETKQQLLIDSASATLWTDCESWRASDGTYRTFTTLRAYFWTPSYRWLAVGPVTVNRIPLSFQGSDYLEYDTTIKAGDEINWDVNGGGVIPSFRTSIQSPLPLSMVSDYPDTLDLGERGFDVIYTLPGTEQVRVEILYNPPD